MPISARAFGYVETLYARGEVPRRHHRNRFITEPCHGWGGLRGLGRPVCTHSVRQSALLGDGKRARNRY